MTLRRIVLICAWFIIAATAHAQIPRVLSYQGVLTDTLGIPKPDSTYGLTFRLYDVVTGGSAMWSEAKFVSLKGGLFSTALGDVTSFPDTLTFNKQYWLGVQVGADPELSPRVRLTAAGYSLNAVKSDTAAYALGSPGSAWKQAGSLAVDRWESPMKLTTTNDIYYDNGKVGIGTASPAARLDIFNPSNTDPSLQLADTVKGPNVSVVHYGPGGDWYIRSASSNGAVYMQDGGGSVTVGRSGFFDPAAKLKIRSSTGDDALLVFLDDPNNTPAAYAGAFYNGNTSAGCTGLYAQGVNGLYGESPSPSGIAVKGVAYAASGRTYGVYGQSISSNGVGVLGEATNASGPTYGVMGTSASLRGAGIWGYSTNEMGYGGYFSNGSGGVALYAQGLAQVNTLDILGGSDLAEPFDVEQGDAAEPGTVMVIDPDHPGKLMVSGSAYDAKVAGIVSGAGDIRPGLTLRQEGVIGGSHVIAIAGRVYCKAEADSSPIEPGDLLTTSSIAGHAMKAADRERSHGTVIGKAMSSLKAGKGLVLVLVNLQ